MFAYQVATTWKWWIHELHSINCWWVLAVSTQHGTNKHSNCTRIIKPHSHWDTIDCLDELMVRYHGKDVWIVVIMNFHHWFKWIWMHSGYHHHGTLLSCIRSTLHVCQLYNDNSAPAIVSSDYSLFININMSIFQSWEIKDRYDPCYSKTSLISHTNHKLNISYFGEFM